MINTLDVRDRLVALLQADPLISDAEAFPHPIKKHDPAGISEAVGVDLCVAVPGERLETASLGGRDAGTDTKLTRVVLMVYVWADRRSDEAADKCIRLTGRLLEAVRHCEKDTTPGDERWYKATLHPVKDDLTTIYATLQGGTQVSVSILNLLTRARRT